jgi:hypothetical protein
MEFEVRTRRSSTATTTQSVSASRLLPTVSTCHDALDNKSGISLGFSGLLITLAPDAAAVFLVPGVISAAVAAGFALSSFWPRPFPSLQATPMRKYLTSDDRFTRLRVFDTLEVVVNETSHALATKAQRLRWSLVALAVAAAWFAVGILFAGV